MCICMQILLYIDVLIIFHILYIYLYIYICPDSQDVIDCIMKQLFSSPPHKSWLISLSHTQTHTQLKLGLVKIYLHFFTPPNVSKCRYIYLEHVIVQYEQFGMYQMSNGPCFSENHRSELAADKAICSSEIKDIYIPHWEMPKPLVHSG